MKFHKFPLPSFLSNPGLSVVYFYREGGKFILCVDFSRGIAEQRDVKVIWKTSHFLNILYPRCMDPRIKFFRISTPADEIFCNAASDPLV